MPKKKYQFECFGVELSLSIGESFTDEEGDNVKVCKYSKVSPIMEHLYISINKGVWFTLERGQRIKNGKVHSDFEII